MEHCPPEILDQIFALACTDDGATGRALSLVSTRIHDISSPHRYFSVHVIGRTCMFRFAKFVQTFRPRIQYLTLDCAILDSPSHTRASATEGHPPTSPSSQFGQARQSHERNRQRPACCNHEAIYTKAETIFTFLAPTLRGLYLIPAGVPLKLDLFTFPLLDTFYLYDSPSDISIHWTPYHFPSLKRVDVSCDMNIQAGHGNTFCFFEGLPALTHLGCCTHIYDGILLSFFFASLLRMNQPNRTAQYSGWLGKLGGLEMFRVGMPDDKLSGLVTHESVGTSGLLKEILYRIPTLVFARRDAIIGGTIPMEEWSFVVGGGHGFCRAQGNEFVPTSS